MDDLISRQAAIDEIDEWIKAFRESGHKQSAADARLIQDGIIQLPSAQLGTNLAEVGTDCISRQAAIDALRAMQTYKLFAGDDMLLIDQAGAMTELMLLPSRTPMQELLDVTADRDYWKAQCHSYEVTINRLTESTQPEIIRCKDCKYWHSGSCECPEHVVYCQDYMVGDIETEAEHFCGYADMREVKI